MSEEQTENISWFIFLQRDPEDTMCYVPWWKSTHRQQGLPREFLSQKNRRAEALLWSGHCFCSGVPELTQGQLGEAGCYWSVSIYIKMGWLGLHLGAVLKDEAEPWLGKQPALGPRK